MAAGFVHLDVRSYFSLKEGAFSPEQLAHQAASLGMPAVAMTDRDGLYGAARFVRACADAGVRPILGASLTVRADDAQAGERDAHVVLLAEDDRGYANLCRLVTDAQLLGERGDPAITGPQICAHAAGMTVVLGPGSHPGRLAAHGRVDAAAALAAPFRDAFGPARWRGRGWRPAVRLHADPAMSGLAERLRCWRSRRTRSATSFPQTRSSPTRSNACAGSSRSPPRTCPGATPRDR